MKCEACVWENDEDVFPPLEFPKNGYATAEWCANEAAKLGIDLSVSGVGEKEHKFRGESRKRCRINSRRKYPCPFKATLPTGEVKYYLQQSIAAREFGITPSAVYFALENKKKSNGIFFEYTEPKSGCISNPLLAINQSTGERRYFVSKKNFCKLTGLAYSSLRYAISSKGNNLAGDWFIRNMICKNGTWR